MISHQRFKHNHLFNQKTGLKCSDKWVRVYLFCWDHLFLLYWKKKPEVVKCWVFLVNIVFKVGAGDSWVFPLSHKHSSFPVFVSTCLRIRKQTADLVIFTYLLHKFVFWWFAEKVFCQTLDVKAHWLLNLSSFVPTSWLIVEWAVV